MSIIEDFVIENGVLKKYKGSNEIVNIPDGITTIGYKAFSGYCGVKHVTLPDSVENIEEEAFVGCILLTSVELSKNTKTIGDKAFRGHSYLKDIMLPMGLESIGVEAFYHTGVKELIIPNSVIKIGNRFVDETTDIVAECADIKILPASYRQKAVISYAKTGGQPHDPRNNSYQKYIKSNAAKIVDIAITYPELLALMCREKLITPKNAEIYMEAAQDSGDAEIIAIVLDYVGNIISKKQKANVKRSEEQKQEAYFERLSKRGTKTGIEGAVFAVSGDLETFKNRNTFKEYIIQRGGRLVTSVSGKVDYLIHNNNSFKGEKYQKAESLGIEIITEKEFNKKAGRQFWIDDHVLIKYTGDEKDVVIPEGVKQIEHEAFYNCSIIESVVIPEGVTEIGSWAFSCCNNLKEVIVPTSVIGIGNNPFYHTPWFESQPKGIICAGLVVIGYSGNNNDIVIPDYIKSIGDCAFEKCKSITSVIIKNGVIRIGKWSFSDCESMSKVILPDTLKSIEDNAFSGCTSLREIKLPEGLNSIGWGCFSGCVNLQNMTVPSSLKEIGIGVFDDCKNLTLYLKDEGYILQYAKEKGIQFKVD